MVYLYTYRRKKTEEELHQMLWKVKFEDIDFTKKRAGSVVRYITINYNRGI